MSHRLNLTSEIDLRVTVLSSSADENFLNYSELIVSVKKGTSSIYRRVLLDNYDKRVDVDFENTLINNSDDFFESNTDYKILVKLVGVNGNSDVDLSDDFEYQERPLSDFDIEITSTSNYENENIATPGQSPTPNMTIQLKENSSTLFKDVVNINLIIENDTKLQTFQIPVEGLITKPSPIHMYFNKKVNDLSYNKLVLEISGNAFDPPEESVLNSHNVLIRDIPQDLISTFGEIIKVHVTLETQYGTTEAKFKDHILSRTPNTVDLGTLHTNTSSNLVDLSNVFLEFDLKPNSVDVNSKVPNASQIARYLLEVSGNDVVIDCSLNLTLDSSGDYVNELKVTIDAYGTLTAQDLCGNEPNVSAQFSNLQLSPLKYYEVRVKGYSNQEEGYSEYWAEQGPVVLEKIPNVTIVESTFGDFFNNNMDDYRVEFKYNYDVETILENIRIRPSLSIEYYDTSTNFKDTHDSDFDSSSNEYIISNSGSFINEYSFDISSNLNNDALLAKTIRIKTQFEFEFASGLKHSRSIITENYSFKTLEVVFPDHSQGYGLKFDDASLNSTSDDEADGFTLTLAPSTEIFEFRNNAASIQEDIYNSLSDSQKTTMTTNIDFVDISYTINNTTYGVRLGSGSLSDYSDKYVFDVSKELLGYDITYYATLNNDRVGTADVSERQILRWVRINDVRVITADYIETDNEFLITNKRGYTLDIAVLKNVGADELEILSDGVSIDDRFSFGTSGNEKWNTSISYTDPSGILGGTDLLISLEDHATNANGKKEVFVLTM